MFVVNYNSIKQSSVLWVSEDVKKELMNLGYCPITFNGKQWAFQNIPEIEGIISKTEGGSNE